MPIKTELDSHAVKTAAVDSVFPGTSIETAEADSDNHAVEAGLGSVSQYPDLGRFRSSMTWKQDGLVAIGEVKTDLIFSSGVDPEVSLADCSFSEDDLEADSVMDSDFVPNSCDESESDSDMSEVIPMKLLHSCMQRSDTVSERPVGLATKLVSGIGDDVSDSAVLVSHSDVEEVSNEEHSDHIVNEVEIGTDGVDLSHKNKKRRKGFHAHALSVTKWKQILLDI